MAMEIKETIKKILKNKGFVGFLYGFIPFLIIGVSILLTAKHGDVVLFVNRHSKENWDPFISFFTNFGLGSYLVAGMIAILFYRVRYGLTGLISLGFTGVFVALLKKGLFSGELRPLNYFYYDDFYRFIYTSEFNYYFSFPSGHTMSIFSVLSLMAIFIDRQWVGVLFFMVALTIGFTRIYLLQHFFLDVYFGAIFGVLSTFLAIWLVNSKLQFQQFSWFDKPLHRIHFKKARAF